MADSTVLEHIRKTISENDVVLYMKGTPVFPQCGFSAAVVNVLTHMGVKFSGVNVLEDMAVREGIKQFSNGPPFPSFTLRASLSAAAISCAKCISPASCWSCLTPKASALNPPLKAGL